jgi:hypothetical protein
VELCLTDSLKLHVPPKKKRIHPSVQGKGNVKLKQSREKERERERFTMFRNAFV